jgi:hypothetical protein
MISKSSTLRFVVSLTALAVVFVVPKVSWADEPEAQPKNYKRVDQAKEAEDELFLPDEYLARDWTTPPEVGRRFAIGEGDSIEGGYLDADEQEELELHRIQEGERSDPFDIFRESPLEPENDGVESADQALDESYKDPAEW